jgi:hypothetical protein
MYYITPVSNNFDGTLGPHGNGPSDHSVLGLPVRLNNLTNQVEHQSYYNLSAIHTNSDNYFEFSSNR